MGNKKLITALTAVVFFLFFSTTFVSAKDDDGTFHVPGTVEGTGKHFEIRDSRYLNITLDSNEDIEARIESAPEMIIISLKSSEKKSSTELTISGFSQNTTYHKYEDDYSYDAPLISDDNGVFSFVQDLGRDHIIFIQPRKSTKFIKDNATGGDCASIGSWDGGSKTCTLNKDANETIQISDDGITLDGNGHSITGKNTGSGIYLAGFRNVVKNVKVSGFSYGIYLTRGGSVFSSSITKNYYGIYANGSSADMSGVAISNNSVSASAMYGIGLFRTKNNNISNNIVGPNNWVGFFQALSENSVYENNDFFSNQTGLVIDGNSNTLRGNTMHENSQSNFYIKSGDMGTNDIGTDNLIDNRPIYYEKNVSGKTYDDSMNMGAFYCANCQNITLKGISLPEKSAQIVFWHTDNSFIEGLNSNDKSVAVELYYSNDNTIRKSTFRSINISYSNRDSIYNNNIMSEDMESSLYPAFSSSFCQDLPAGGNYWKINDSACEDLNNDKICDSPVYFDGGMDSYPWAREFDFSRPSGNSNVLFFPGIKASKLYKRGSIFEDQLWPPNYFGNDVLELALDENGGSINDVYTRDIISEVGAPWTGSNIYKTFMGKLASLKSDGTINDYKLFAYDWRKSVEDTAQNRTPYPDGEIKSAVAEIRTLAETAQNEKVTIVAHSMGGLLAKAVMMELEKSGEAEKVDKIVFVDTPQMGTPLAILSMLYGYDESLIIGTLMNQSQARMLAENLPGAYDLLPSQKYFLRMENPFITFSSERTLYKDFKDAYGEGIDSADEFEKFLTGEGDGREKPAANDTDFENVLHGSMIKEALEMHERIDSWMPPDGVQAIEIAGWGLDTIFGIDYAEKEDVKCYAYMGYLVPSCVGMNEYKPVYEPKFTVDGDKVVTTPSSLMLSEGENVKKYWVNLHDNNKWLSINRNHADILEMDNLIDFLSDIISNKESNTLPDYIKNYRPNDYANAKPRIRMSLYSPLDIHLYDSQGRHTGPKKVVDENGNEGTIFEEAIPNSYYLQLGERKYVGVPEGEDVHMEMDGYDSGSYTLHMEKISVGETGEEKVYETTFKNLPVSPETKVSLDIPQTGLENLSDLKADFNGDGSDDYAVVPVSNGEAELPDMIPPETKVELSGTEGENGWYWGDVALKLSAEDNLGGSGMGVISYSLDEGVSWQNYEEPLVISQEKITDFRYFAIDKAGNREETKTETVKIDKTAPEAKIIFNQSGQKLDIAGVDNLSANVAVEIDKNGTDVNSNWKKYIFFRFFDIINKEKKQKNIVVALIDEAGNKTGVVLEKNKEGGHRVDVSPASVAYNGEKIEFPKSLLQYKWNFSEKKESYLLFGAHIKTGDAVLESHYFPKKNETWIMERPRKLDESEGDEGAERRPAKIKMPGMIVPYIQTNQGKIETKY